MDREAVVRRFLAASGRDLDALLDPFTDDTVMELVARGITVEGREACRDLLAATYAAAHWDLEVLDLSERPERDTVIAEYVSEGHLNETGDPFRARHVGILRFAGDRVCWSREYTLQLGAPR